MGATTKTLYDTDFAEWSARTAELVRAGRLEEVDLEHVAEEIEDLGKRDRRALLSQLQRMLMHMIKQRIQPERNGPSCQSSIADARKQMALLLKDSPSLRVYLQDNLQETYLDAVEMAAIETQVSVDGLPKECPYTLQELLGS
jgi:hypothetical protein